MEIRKNFFINVFIFSLILTIPNVEAKKVDFKPSDSIKSFCLGKNTENDNSKIEKIEIKVNKNKIWAKNLLNLHVNFQREKSQSQHNNWFPNFRISDKFKKKYKSKVYINYSNSTKCVFNSYVRITGDLWWHLGWNKGTPITSLNVELIDGHVENITRFKMLLPASRYGSNEIFTSTLLKKT